MWRTYFALERDMPDWYTLPSSTQKTFAVCQSVLLKQFSSPDQDILRMYFTSRWGDDLYAVEDYSLKHNIPTKVIWIVIRRANRKVMEEIGLLERKEDDNEDSCD